MTVIREDDVIASVADALQYISYYHTPDFIRRWGVRMPWSRARRRATPSRRFSPIRACAPKVIGRFARTPASSWCSSKWAWASRWDAKLDLEAMINEGVRRAYLNPDNKLRASIVSDPAFKRGNTRDNTPAVIHTEFGPGEQGRDHGGREGRRLREQIHVRHVEPLGFGGRLGS
jgi:fumarate hydratase class I